MTKSILWLRRDLRLSDHPALTAACENSDSLAVVYILDPALRVKEASSWYLHNSLIALKKDLALQGHQLNFYAGNALKILTDLCTEHKINHVYASHVYEPDLLNLDRKIAHELEKQNTLFSRYQGSLLVEPWHLVNKQGNPYKVFTPFYKQVISQLNLPQLLPIPELPSALLLSDSVNLNDLELLPRIKWYQGFREFFQPGERQVWKRLRKFEQKPVLYYKEQRNFPSIDGTSVLGPALHYGELSPLQVWHLMNKKRSYEAVESYLRQLIWREFSYYLYYHFDNLTYSALNDKWDSFPWKQNVNYLNAWQTGQTGVPIVDAGMRQLWQTGWMHNRLRMIVASYLIKNLNIHWHAGREWFECTLVDHDPANNALGWQWCAGCGADAAPYFRIFNPVRQAEKFDPNGTYIKKWVPELTNLDTNSLYAPWEAKAETLKLAGVELGKTYPKPIVNLSESRQQALDQYQNFK
ncbi:MAG: DNA photolyase family protein [Lentisphaeria bacterium]|nr:DNA photolyase family protein [Lentisphaeria bacterium]